MAQMGFFGKLKLNAGGAIRNFKANPNFKSLKSEIGETLKESIVARFRKSKIGVDLESRAIEQAVKERTPVAVYAAGGAVILVLAVLLFKKRGR